MAAGLAYVKIPPVFILDLSEHILFFYSQNNENAVG